MYKIIFTKPFIRKSSRITKNNKELQEKIKNGLEDLSKDPFLPSLKTHKANTKEHGKRYSSTVTGDLRIIWDYGEKELTIFALDLGGHSGKNKVYK